MWMNLLKETDLKFVFTSHFEHLNMYTSPLSLEYIFFFFPVFHELF